MRTAWVVASFVVAGAGVAGVGASNLTGSDALRTLTLDLTTVTSLSGSPLCPAATSIAYLGGGSGRGESQMLVGRQVIAPMSRFLGTNVCNGINGSGTPTTANGLVVALDGLAIVSSAAQAGTVACNGATGGDTATACTVDAGVPISPRFGLALSGTVNGYAFADWKDVLRILYFGKDHNGTKNCNSSIRQFLANNWSSVFASGCTSPTCTAIKHLFRQDDASGSTDLFASLLGESAPSETEGPAASMGVAGQIGAYFMGSDTFCNSAVNAPAPFNMTFPGKNPGQEPGAGFSIVPNDHQDGDPIRRPCSSGRSLEWVCQTSLDLANTQVTGSGSSAAFVCGATGDGTCPTGETCVAGTSGSQCWGPSLGLLLPVVAANTLGVDQYHVNECSGAVNSVNAPPVPGVGGRGVMNAGICPNGDIPTAGVCQVPIDTNTNSPNCLASASQQPQGALAFTQGVYDVSTGVAAGSGNGPAPNTVDGRVYNEYVWKNIGTVTAPVWSIAQDDSGRPMYGAFYRIHSHFTTLSGTAPCTQADATLQIGCLVAASPCSFGFAARPAAFQAGAAAMKVQGVPPVTACIQALGAPPPAAYPLARKVYLNTIAGFGAASAAELALAQCEADTATLNQAILFENFIPLPTTGPNAINGGNALCEDFNEPMLCGSGGSNVNGCAATAAISGMPQGAAQVTCGNGIKEAFEQCDPGAPLGSTDNPCATSCSTTCVCN